MVISHTSHNGLLREAIVMAATYDQLSIAVVHIEPCC